MTKIYGKSFMLCASNLKVTMVFCRYKTKIKIQKQHNNDPVNVNYLSYPDMCEDQ
jgi:hypothetical protein